MAGVRQAVIRQNLDLQSEVIRLINVIGWNPFEKPIDLLSWEDIGHIKRLAKECVA